MTYDTVSTTTKEETIYTTTTAQQTQTTTIYTTTTTESTYTETIPVITTTETTKTDTVSTEQTAGAEKKSTGNVSYKTISVTNTKVYGPDLDAVCNITVSVIKTACETITISPTAVTTYRDLIELANSVLTAEEVYMDGVGSVHAVYADEPDGELFVYFDFSSSTGNNYKGEYNFIVPLECTATVITTSTVDRTATTGTKLSTLGITSTQYITITNDGTKTVITCSSSDTIGSVTAKLTSAGVTASFSNGTFLISATDSAYISGMSSGLKSALKLSGSFSTVTTVKTEVTTTILTTTTVEETHTTTISTTTTTEETRTLTVFVTTTTSSTQTVTLLTTATETATGDTALETMGLTSSTNITISKDGTKSTVSLDKDMTVNDLISLLQNYGLRVDFTNSKLTIEGDGDSYVSSPQLESLFKLSPVKKTTSIQSVNTESERQTYEKNLLDELGDVYAPGSFDLQVGIGSEQNSKVTIQTSFSLVGYSDFRNIGIDKKNYLEALDEMLAEVAARQTELGAARNRIESALEEISIHYENLVSSLSTIRDADIAEESSEYIKMQILQQASATLLATANQTPSIALQLL